MPRSDDLAPPSGPTPEAVVNVLLYGTPAARHHLAGELAGRDDRTMLHLLIATVGSAEPWRLRARCLEVVGMIAGTADRDTAEEILGSLGHGHPNAAS